MREVLGSRFGKRHICKTCGKKGRFILSPAGVKLRKKQVAARTNKYRDKNREEVRRKGREYYAVNRVKMTAYSRLWEKKRSESPAYRKKKAEASALYRKNNPLKTKASQRKSTRKQKYGEFADASAILWELRGMIQKRKRPRKRKWVYEEA